MRGKFLGGSATASNNDKLFTQYNTYSDLPSTGTDDQIALVQNPTGIILTSGRRKAGFYQYNNNTWNFLGNRITTVESTNSLPQITASSQSSWTLGWGSTPNRTGAVTSSAFSGNGLYLNQSGAESAGIWLSGDHVVLWSPFDHRHWQMDEDASSTGFGFTNTGSMASYSDISLKTDLKAKKVNLEALKHLQLYSFQWKEFLTLSKTIKSDLEKFDAGDQEVYEKWREKYADKLKSINNGKSEAENLRILITRRLRRAIKKTNGLSFIAQDIQKFAPECVMSAKSEGLDNDFLMVDWTAFQQYFNQALLDLLKAIDKKTNILVPTLDINNISSSLSQLLDYHENKYKDVTVNFKGAKIIVNNTLKFRQLLQEQKETLVEQIYLNEIEESAAVFNYFYNKTLIPIPLKYLRVLYVKLTNLATEQFMTIEKEKEKALMSIEQSEDKVSMANEKVNEIINLISVKKTINLE